MTTRTAVLVYAGLALAAAVAIAQQNFDLVEIRTEKLAEGAYALVGAGGNIGLASGPDGALLIDDQFAPLTPKLKAAVAAVTDRPIRFVLNTHYHPAMKPDRFIGMVVADLTNDC